MDVSSSSIALCQDFVYSITIIPAFYLQAPTATTFEETCEAQKCKLGYMIKGKVKVTFVQALRLCTGRTSHRGVEV